MGYLQSHIEDFDKRFFVLEIGTGGFVAWAVGTFLLGKRHSSICHLSHYWSMCSLFERDSSNHKKEGSFIFRKINYPGSSGRKRGNSVKKFLALLLIVGLFFCFCTVALADETPIDLAGDSWLSYATEVLSTPVRLVSPAFAEDGDKDPHPVIATFETKTDSKKAPYVGLITTMILMLAIIFAIKGLRRNGKRGSPGNIFSSDGVDALQQEAERLGERICGEIWKAKKTAKGLLDEIDQEYYENLEAVKNVIGLATAEKKEE